ncbi:MAG: hypothetical protein CR975_03520 [Gammaproteobacteria bacterium]|nr:MAG: hypothetical protein CR975_03520 [Gammaproteobacteria bacterium]
MITKLISDIEYAFATVEYPGDYNIAPIDGMEGSEVNDIFKGKSWRDIHFEAVSQLSYALLYFKPKAFIYFLPAFLIGCIKDQKAEFGSSCDTILICFTPPDNKDKAFEARMKLFNKNQLNLIGRFLHYLMAIDIQEKSKIQSALNYIEQKIKA